jgi:acetyl-CoA carboxylase biotin carboxyl carrier protein
MTEKREMDFQAVKQLVELMIENDLVEAEVVDGKNKIHLKRPQPMTHLPAGYVQYGAAAIGQPGTAPAQHTQTDTKSQETSLVEITSPIIGTFYASPSPDSDPYVNLGDSVEPDTVVCIIEAMKVMNEIKAETSGTVVELLCQTGQTVEFGQALFKVRPD